MGELYKLEFPNGKAYIGITKKTAVHRLNQHKTMLRGGKHTALYNAWRKHCEPKLVVLAIVEDYDLAETEIRAIKVFNTLVPNGYNMTEGGQTSPSLSPSAKLKMSLAKLGKPNASVAASNKRREYSKETKVKMSAAAKGRVCSEITRSKISSANKRGDNSFGESAFGESAFGEGEEFLNEFIRNLKLEN